MPNRKLGVFLCHAKEDKPTVRELYRKLTAEGWMDVWLDEEKLFPGQNWDLEIEKAVETSDAVIVCLSNKSVNKEGYVHAEMGFILDIARTKPEETIFVIPLRLEDCQVPRRLRTWQYADYFPREERGRAYERLLRSLKLRAQRLDLLRGDLDGQEAGRIGNQEENKESEKGRLERVGLAGTANEYVEGEKQKRAGTTFWRRSKWYIMGGVVLVSSIALVLNYMMKNPPTENRAVTETPPQPLSTSIAAPTSPSPEATGAISVTPTPAAGNSWVSPKDGMTMLYVPSGSFTMGGTAGQAFTECQNYRSDCQLSWFNDEYPPHQVVLSSFWIDQTEVTNAMYAKCVQAGICRAPGSIQSRTRQVYHGNPEYDDYPVIYVSWSDAKTYCQWRGHFSRLPTEAEWEKAASWDADRKEKRVYPWGDSVDCSLANFLGTSSSCVGDTNKVGNYPENASFYGALDMAGNVWEWVADFYGQLYYVDSPSKDPLGPTSDTYHVLRGGSWNEYASHIRATFRRGATPVTIGNDIGFRCARTE